MCEIARKRGKWCYRLCEETVAPTQHYLERWGTAMLRVAMEIMAEPAAGDTPGMLGTAAGYEQRGRIACLIIDQLRSWHPFRTPKQRGKRGRASGNPGRPGDTEPIPSPVQD